MREVYRDVEDYSSRADEKFEFPEGLLVERPVCDDTHKLATKYCPRQSDELYIADAPLPEVCPMHSGDGGGRRRRRF